MSTILNIGLAGNDGSTVDPRRALALLSSIGGLVVSAATILPSDTEPTLVVQANRPLSPIAATEIAKALHQDAIAQWDGLSGQLYGPNAAAWGPFDPAFFIQPDGTRLSTVEVRTAA